MREGVDMADRLGQMFKLMSQPKSEKLLRALDTHSGGSFGSPQKVKPPRPSTQHPSLPIPTAPPLPRGFVQNPPPRPKVPHPGLPIPAAPPLPTPEQQSRQLAISRLEREIAHAAKELDRLHQNCLEALGTPQLNGCVAAFELQARGANEKMRDYNEKTKLLL
jgi:hypothetical protein